MKSAAGTPVVRTALFVGLASLMHGQVGVLTQHNDNARSGVNLQEKTLTPRNVSVSTFGRLFTRSVDGQIYAQPLYVPNVRINGRSVNVVYVATENNTVYAFDADLAAASAPLWSRNLGMAVNASAICTDDTNPLIGITSTPVIDTTSNWLYVVAKTTEADGSYAQRLHVIDIRTGAEVTGIGSPVKISASVAGSGDGSINGVVTFDALHQLNRPGLLLTNGYVVLAFGSHCDTFPYHGWVFAYRANNLPATPLVFNADPNTGRSGIWQSGQGLATDGTGIYLITGNGGFDANTGGSDFGDSMIRLTLPTAVPALSVADYFTPYNQDALGTADLDLGSGGPVLLPQLPGNTAQLLIGGGKGGTLYLVNRNNMGKYNITGDNVVQEIAMGSGRMFASPVFWQGPNYLYTWPGGDTLKQYVWNSTTGSFTTPAVATNNVTSYMPGGAISLSANGTSSGILWVTEPLQDAEGQVAVPGILRAYDATNVSRELWNSLQNAARDNFGNFAKFCPATIANGKVYVGTFSNALAVYGIIHGRR